MKETPPPAAKARYVPPRVVVLSTRNTEGMTGAASEGTSFPGGVS
jgi:hypothetical protein